VIRVNRSSDQQDRQAPRVFEANQVPEVSTAKGVSPVHKASKVKGANPAKRAGAARKVIQGNPSSGLLDRQVCRVHRACRVFKVSPAKEAILVHKVPEVKKANTVKMASVVRKAMRVNRWSDLLGRQARRVLGGNQVPKESVAKRGAPVHKASKVKRVNLVKMASVGRKEIRGNRSLGRQVRRVYRGNLVLGASVASRASQVRKALAVKGANPASAV
jgi:hypothetical protein